MPTLANDLRADDWSVLMRKSTDVRVAGAALYFLPVTTRIPLKFGTETTTSVTCARVSIQVTNGQSRSATGWGETPLSVQWVWPSKLAYEARHEALKEFCRILAEAWVQFESSGHPLEIGSDFQEGILPQLLARFNQQQKQLAEPMPWLAALVCCSAFDLALHDAYGQLHQRPVYETYNAEFMNRDLGDFLKAADGAAVEFKGRHPEDFLVNHPPTR